MQTAELAQADAPIGRFKRWPRRYTVVGLFALSTVLCYLDRVNISIAIIPLARAAGYNSAQSGLVLSAFFWGYLWLQLPGGWLADRFGGKKVLGVGVAAWSLATFLTPAAATSLGLLLCVRALLGAGEAVNFPAIHSLAARWTFACERGRALALHLSSTSLGTVIALRVSPPIILAFGWPSVFYLSGALGLARLLAWGVKAADWPEGCAGVDAAELAEIRAGRPRVTSAHDVPWRLFLREKAVWAIVIAHLCNNFGFFMLLLWLPSYLEHAFHVPMRELGPLVAAPYVAGFAVGNLSGWLVDDLRARGMSLTVVRKLLQSLAFTTAAAGLVAMPAARSATQAAAVATVSISALAFGNGGIGVNHLDLAPDYAGILMGISNTVATLPGVVGVAATGFIVQATGSFTAAFYLAALIYGAGMVAFLAWASGERKF